MERVASSERFRAELDDVLAGLAGEQGRSRRSDVSERG